MSRDVAEVEELLLNFVSAEEDNGGDWHEWHEWESVAQNHIWKELFPNDPEPEWVYVPLGERDDEAAEADKRWRAWRNRFWEFFKEYKAPLWVTVPELGKVRVTEQFGGEGKGDQYWMVFEVDCGCGPDNRFFRIDGWYASYDGGYYDGNLYEVKPVQKVVTFYE